MMMSCSLISVTERLPGPALELGALPPVSSLSAVTAGIQLSVPGLQLTMLVTLMVTLGEVTMLVTRRVLALMVTRELVPGLVGAQLLRAALLAHCARAPR